MNSFRSKPALAASIALLAGFFAVTHAAMFWSPQSSAAAMALFSFLHPGINRFPGRWLMIEGATLLVGLAVVTLFGRALSDHWPWARLRALPSILRRSWRQMIWVFLLGYLFPTFVSAGYVFTGRTPLLHEASLLQIIYLLGYISPLAGFCCCVRLLFGAKRWPLDKGFGYIAAIAALFDLAWRIVGAVGMGEFLPLLGAMEVSALSSGLSIAISSIVSIAIAWSGLMLARKDTEAPLARSGHRRALVYFVLGGFTVSVALHKISVVSLLLTSVPILYAMLYGGMIAIFGGAVLLCLCDGIALLTDGTAAAHAAQDAERPAPAGAIRGVLAGLSAGGFWIDLAGSFGITVVLIAIAYGLVSRVPAMVAAFMMPIVIFILVIGPILVFITGVLRGRPGIAAAPALIFLVAVGIRYGSVIVATHHAQAAVAEAANLNIYPFEEPTQTHEFVVIEDSYDNRPDGACSDLCEQILTASDYAVALPEQGSAHWRVYRTGKGRDLCLQPARVKSYFARLALGYVDSCTVMSHEQARPDGLVIRENQSGDAPVRKLLPTGVDASVLEFYERIDGNDRLLGRIVSGTVQPPLLSDQPPTATPVQMSAAKFYATALKLPIGDAPPSTDAHMAEAVASLEAMFPDPEFGKQARQVFPQLGRTAKSEAGAQPLRDAILRYWQSGDPELIKLGLRTVLFLRASGLDFAKPGVAAFVGSDDPAIMKSAVLALPAFGKDLEFAKAPLADLILSDRIAAYGDDSSPLAELSHLTDLLKSVPGGFAPESRERARAVLAGGPDFPKGRLFATLAIVAHGDDRNRQEAADLILRLQGESFERTVSAASVGYRALGARTTEDFWSEPEMKQLVARAATVSDQNLIWYLRAIQFQTTGRSSRPALRDLLNERADRLAGGSPEDQALAKKMRREASQMAY